MRSPATPSDLARDLAGLGVRAGDLLMVHASLRAIGPVVDRASGVIRALEAAVGEGGTLFMTLGAVEGVPFDALATPADPDIGVLAEVFRRTPGTLVSDHPEGRFGARGRRSRELVSDVPWNDYYGPGSPLERFANANGKVLRLGANVDTVTLLHWSEYLADVPNKRRVTRESRVVASGGNVETRKVECLDDSDGIVDWAGADYFGVLLTDYLREHLPTGRARQGLVGGATSELIDGPHLVAFGAAWMTTHLARFA